MMKQIGVFISQFRLLVMQVIIYLQNLPQFQLNCTSSDYFGEVTASFSSL